MYGYAKGSIADRMTNEQRKAWKRQMAREAADAAVYEAQLGHRRYPRPRSIAEV
jgi:hypothetical protein